MQSPEKADKVAEVTLLRYGSLYRTLATKKGLCRHIFGHTVLWSLKIMLWVWPCCLCKARQQCSQGQCVSDACISAGRLCGLHGFLHAPCADVHRLVVLSGGHSVAGCFLLPVEQPQACSTCERW